MDVIVPILAFLTLGGLAGWGVRMGTSYQSNLNQAWADVGNHLGLSVAPFSIGKTGRLAGRIRGVEVVVSTRSSSNNNQTVTRFELRYPSSGPDVRLSRQRAVNGFFRKLLGQRDVIINDPVFDDNVIIDSADPLEVGRFLTPTRRMSVLSVLTSWHSAEITNRSLYTERPGVMRDARELHGSIVRLVDLALLMSAPDEVDHALLLEQRGDLAAAAEELHVLNASTPNTFTQMLEAEALIAMGERPAAAAILEQVEAAAPADPEVAGWRKLAAKPMPAAPTSTSPAVPAASAATSSPPAIPAAPADPTFTAAATIDDLFGTDRMGFETEERFSIAYRGRVVQWTGTVDSLRSFRSDSDFGSEPGTKATVHIGSLGDSRLVTSQVHAIVHLPENAPVTRGDEITFTGSLVRVDRYMRNLYVATARLS